MIDVDAARAFVHLHARLIDRVRLARLLDGAPAERVVAALAPYANADGGFGHALEPDVRAAPSQPVATLTAFDLLHEAGAPATPVLARALDWLEALAYEDGGIPFSPPSVAEAPHAPWMAPSEGSSLHMTCAVVSSALRLTDDHPWLERATAFCRERIAALDAPSAYETKYVLELCDATGDAAGVERIRPAIPPDGRLPVQGGVEGEALTPLELAPAPDHAARRLFAPAAIEQALDYLEAEQLADGGWEFPWLHWNPAVAWEWRGRRTVDALVLLRANGRL